MTLSAPHKGNASLLSAHTHENIGARDRQTDLFTLLQLRQMFHDATVKHLPYL